MPSLQSIAELSWRQLYPNPGDETPISLEEFISTARNEFAYQTLLLAWKEKVDEGYFDVPSYLLSEVEKEIVNNEMDISDLKVFKSLPQEVWAVNIGGFTCKCKYVKSTANLSQLLCDDDSLDDAAKTYFFLGKKIIFPKGVHTSPLKLVYANIGNDVNSLIEVDEAIGALIRQRLNEIYLGKVAPVDVTNNANPNN